MMQDRIEHDYRVTAWWTSGRTGIAITDSAPNAIHFTAPKNFGGLEGRWTPEELLLASIAACYTTTLRSIASSAHADFTDLEVEASGTIQKVDSGYAFTQIVIRPILKITNINQREHTLDLLKKAQRMCLISRALEAPVRFEPQMEVIESATVS